MYPLTFSGLLFCIKASASLDFTSCYRVNARSLPAGNFVVSFDVVPLYFRAYYVDDDRH